MEGRVERSVFNLEHLLRAPLNRVGDCLAMSRSRHECSKNQHVQGTLNHLGLQRGPASWHVSIDDRLEYTASDEKVHNKLATSWVDERHGGTSCVREAPSAGYAHGPSVSFAPARQRYVQLRSPM